MYKKHKQLQSSSIQQAQGLNFCYNCCNLLYLFVSSCKNDSKFSYLFGKNFPPGIDKIAYFFELIFVRIWITNKNLPIVGYNGRNWGLIFFI